MCSNSGIWVCWLLEIGDLGFNRFGCDGLWLGSKVVLEGAGVCGGSL